MIKFALVNNITFNSTVPDKKPMLFVPDIDYISNFFSGSISNVSEVYHRGFDIDTKMDSLTNILNGYDYDDKDIIKTFLDSSEVKLKNDFDTYFIDGKMELVASDFVIDSSSTNSGMSAIQKMILQTLFETQKPYMEIIKLVTDNFLFIEDIIANALCIVDKSKNPRTNPKALNYQKNKEEFQIGMSRLMELTKFDNTINRKDIFTTNDLPSINSEVISIEYSTGEYDPNVQYEYIYKNIYETRVNLDNVENIYNDSEDVDEVKKDIIILGVFDQEGNKLVEEDIPTWITNSPKYIGTFDMFNDGGYIWENVNGQKKIQKDKPSGIGWKMKTYKTTMRVNGKSHYYKEPIMDYSNSNVDIYNIYKSMYLDILNQDNMDKNTTESIMSILTNGDDKSDDLKKKSTLSTHIDMMMQHCYLKRYQGESIPLPESPFLPKKIEENNEIYYIDPESEYDFKIIKFNPKIVKQSESVVLNKNIEEMVGPFSLGKYGEEENHTIGNRTYWTIEGNEKTYYVVEGIHSSLNSSDETIGTEGTSGNKKDYKKIVHIFKLIPKFIKLIIKLATKLYPQINDLIKLFSNPKELPSFVTKPIFNKLGDNNGTEDVKFEVFSRDFIQEYSNFKNASSSHTVDENREIINNSILKNYVYINDENEPKLLVDTSYATTLFGINFNLSLEDYLPNVNIDTKTESEYREEINNLIDNNNLKEASKILTFSKSIYKDSNYSDIENEISDRSYYSYEGIENNNMVSYILELVNTPLKIVEKIINKILDFFKSLVNPFVVIDKVTEFLTFKWLTDILKPTFILELLDIKFDIKKYVDILNISKFTTNFTLSEIISMTGTKASIESLRNNNGVDETGSEILNIGIKDSYNIMDFENTNLLPLLLNQINMNSSQFGTYSEIMRNGGLVDMSKILSMPFIPKLPSYNIDQISTLGLGPIENALKSSFIMIQSVINSFIDLIFSLFGLGSIMKIPHISLTSMLATEYVNNLLDTNDTETIIDLLNNIDDTVVGDIMNGYETDYIFDLTLSSGKHYKDLTYDKLVEKISDYNVVNIIYNRI